MKIKNSKKLWKIKPRPFICARFHQNPSTSAVSTTVWSSSKIWFSDILPHFLKEFIKETRQKSENLKIWNFQNHVSRDLAKIFKIARELPVDLGELKKVVKKNWKKCFPISLKTGSRNEHIWYFASFSKIRICPMFKIL